MPVEPDFSVLFLILQRRWKRNTSFSHFWQQTRGGGGLFFVRRWWLVVVVVFFFFSSSFSVVVVVVVESLSAYHPHTPPRKALGGGIMITWGGTVNPNLF